ncbi:hypothetical protein NMY22_g12843 [Coprinellus aureogranulatus]|nr:hypothetical protein NMY22_g12843 [Coprinellus aureogranulatus]
MCHLRHLSLQDLYGMNPENLVEDVHNWTRKSSEGIGYLCLVQFLIIMDAFSRRSIIPVSVTSSFGPYRRECRSKVSIRRRRMTLARPWITTAGIVARRKGNEKRKENRQTEEDLDRDVCRKICGLSRCEASKSRMSTPPPSPGRCVVWYRLQQDYAEFLLDSAPIRLQESVVCHRTVSYFHAQLSTYESSRPVKCSRLEHITRGQVSGFPLILPSANSQPALRRRHPPTSMMPHPKRASSTLISGFMNALKPSSKLDVPASTPPYSKKYAASATFLPTTSLLGEHP